jgi:hypothetical protein
MDLAVLSQSSHGLPSRGLEHGQYNSPSIEMLSKATAAAAAARKLMTPLTQMSETMV